MVIGPLEHKTNNSFRNMDDFESYINAIDVDYDSEDVTFTGYFYKLNTPQFDVVKRSAYDKVTDYIIEIFEYKGQYCLKPISGMYFIKCNNYFNKTDYAEEFRDFIRNERYWSREMNSARIPPFSNNYDINIGSFVRTRRNPRNITQRSISLFINNIHFCLNWKSNTISFNHAIEEV